MQEKLEQTQKAVQEKNAQVLSLQSSLDEKEIELSQSEERTQKQAASLAQLQDDLNNVRCLHG